MNAIAVGFLCACVAVITVEYLDNSDVQKELLELKIQEKKLNIQVLKLELSE